MRNGLLELAHAARVEAAAVAADERLDGLQVVAERDERATILDQPLDERADVRKRRVRLLLREEPHLSP